ncbi:GNAT family N-acetyltransferase [Pseudonocardia sp. HH130630-07]|uniref:GNAT family N-acetyltransferase n=1 Tax=Pseudonocardia sp. HH130630-07 TaxID=1690815 RepID=UPI000814B9EB|nr:GNAT family N-acetyltransferase [Pseudonocardia sp. HH130630-07]ANY05466.1 acetyltransferase [Pseudonocardia sp. HH130630-07]
MADNGLSSIPDAGLGDGSDGGTWEHGGRALRVRVADERDVAALGRLRRQWLEERAGRAVPDASFEEAFAAWWRVEQPRRAFWVAEAGSDRAGWTPVGSINVLETVQMPRPGGRGARTGQVGNAFVLAAFAEAGVPRVLLSAVVGHARRRGYRRLMLAPTAGSAAFYRRAGFVPAGDSLLVLEQ